MTEEIKTITNPNKLLTRNEVQEEFGIPRQWLEKAALSGECPPYVRLANRMIRYQRRVLEAWIAGRTFVSTEQYKKRSAQNDEQE